MNKETFYNIDMEHKDGAFTVKLDDSIKYSSKMNFSSCGMSYTLFADNTSNLGVNQFFNGRINYCVIYCNDACMRDLIPCYSTTTVTNAEGSLVPANTKGLYDLVEGKFYTNQGTGEFIAGPEV